MTYTHEEVRPPFLPKTLGYAETMYEGGRLGCLLMERIAFTFHELLEKFSEENPSPECLELVGVCVRRTGLTHFIEPGLAHLIQPWLAHLIQPWMAHVIEPWLAHLIQHWLAHLIQPRLAHLIEPWLAHLMEPWPTHLIEPWLAH